MDAERLELMRKCLPEKLLQSFLINEALTVILKNNPIEPEVDWDLNPHLHIIYVCEQVAKEVTRQTIPCTQEDVMLYWLTMAIHWKMFLPWKLG